MFDESGPPRVHTRGCLPHRRFTQICLTFRPPHCPHCFPPHTGLRNFEFLRGAAAQRVESKKNGRVEQSRGIMIVNGRWRRETRRKGKGRRPANIRCMKFPFACHTGTNSSREIDAATGMPRFRRIYQDPRRIFRPCFSHRDSASFRTAKFEIQPSNSASH